MLKKVKSRLSDLVTRTYSNAIATASTVKAKLQEKDGSFMTDHALAIVISVVAAAILIGIVVALLTGKIGPQLNNKVDDFFGMAP